MVPGNYDPIRPDTKGDDPALAMLLKADGFAHKVARAQYRQLPVTDSPLRVLTRHDWAGNVRELGNYMGRAAVVSELTGLDLGALPGSAPPAPVGPAQGPKVDLDDPGLDERERVIAALEEAGWVQAKAARLLKARTLPNGAGSG